MNQPDRTSAEAVQYWYDAATERREERDRLRAVVARIQQMTDAWEQRLPELIRTPAVVSALRAALEPAVQPAADRAALRQRVAANMREHWLYGEPDADGNLSCRCGNWREPGAAKNNANDWDSHLADVALAASLSALPTPVDRTALRDRTAETAYRAMHTSRSWDRESNSVRAQFFDVADAVLAVLPDPTSPPAAASFVPPAAEGLPPAALDSARKGATMLDAWAEDPHGRNFLAHALVQLARDGWLRTEPSEGFEPVQDRDDVAEPQDFDELRRLAGEQPVTEA